MNVVWSDEALYALVALEIELAERYSIEKAAQMVDELVQPGRVAAVLTADHVAAVD